MLTVSVHDAHLRRHRAWMATPTAADLTRRRCGLIEGVFGTIKDQLHAHRFLTRGRERVAAEWAMLAVGYNLRTLARIWARSQGSGPPLPVTGFGT